MRVLFVTIGDIKVPSSRVRALQYIPYLEKEGITCSHIQYRKGYYLKYKVYGARKSLLHRILTRFLTIFLKAYDYLLFSKLRLIQIWFSYPEYDLVFIQKVVLPTFLLKRMT